MKCVPLFLLSFPLVLSIPLLRCIVRGRDRNKISGRAAALGTDCTALGDADFCTVLYVTHLSPPSLFSPPSPPLPSLPSTLNLPSHPVLRRVSPGVGGGGGGGVRPVRERGRERERENERVRESERGEGRRESERRFSYFQCFNFSRYLSALLSANYLSSSVLPPFAFSHARMPFFCRFL